MYIKLTVSTYIRLLRDKITRLAEKTTRVSRPCQPLCAASPAGGPLRGGKQGQGPEVWGSPSGEPDRLAVRSLLEVTNIANHQVAATLADRMNTICGSIRAEALVDLSNTEILAELSSRGVCRVERLASRRLATLGPNPTIKLNFRGKTLPQSVLCGYLVVPVSPWVPAPTQCRHCWQSGHPSRNCRRRAGVCGRCAGGHPTDWCTDPRSAPTVRAPTRLGTGPVRTSGKSASAISTTRTRPSGHLRPRAKEVAPPGRCPRRSGPRCPRPPPLSPPVGSEPTRPRSADQGEQDRGQEGISDSESQGDDGGDNASATGPSEAHSSPSAATTSPFGSAPTATSSPADGRCPSTGLLLQARAVFLQAAPDVDAQHALASGSDMPSVPQEVSPE